MRFVKRLKLLKDCISPIVLSELKVGAYRSANPLQNLHKIEAALFDSELLPIDVITSDKFVSVKIALFAKGNPIADNDIWIASSAMQHHLQLLTNDNDFKKIEGLVLI